MTRPKKQPVYIFEVVVEGSGYFPLDMLRYDNAVPAHQEDIIKIDGRDRRRVTLRQFSFSGNGPTIGRWESFGWSVISTRSVVY